MAEISVSDLFLKPNNRFDESSLQLNDSENSLDAVEKLTLMAPLRLGSMKSISSMLLRSTGIISPLGHRTNPKHALEPDKIKTHLSSKKRGFNFKHTRCPWKVKKYIHRRRPQKVSYFLWSKTQHMYQCPRRIDCVAHPEGLFQ